MTERTDDVAEQETPRGDGTRPEGGVWQEEDQSWTGSCTSSLCGAGEPFMTTGWPTKKSATERIGQHLDEHSEGTPMEDLASFRAARGLGVNGEGRAYVLPENATRVK